MNSFALQVGILLLIMAIFTAIQSTIRKLFIQALERQRGSFLQALQEMQIRASGPDTGAVPAAKPPTGPTKSPTGGRHVRRPTQLPN